LRGLELCNDGMTNVSTWQLDDHGQVLWSLSAQGPEDWAGEDPFPGPLLPLGHRLDQYVRHPGEQAENQMLIQLNLRHKGTVSRDF
jgi:hypothetical protein